MSCHFSFFSYFKISQHIHIEFYSTPLGLQLKSNHSNWRIHQRHQQRGNISSWLIPEHSCGIFTALFSHVNTTSERKDWQLCWNSTSTYHQSCGRPRKGCHSLAGGGSLKILCHCGAKVVKRKPNLLQWLFNHQSPVGVCVYLHVWIKSWILKDCFSRKVVYLSLLESKQGAGLSGLANSCLWSRVVEIYVWLWLVLKW